MTKDDLKTGMVVEISDGSKFMVIKGDFNTTVYGKQSLMFISHNGYAIGDSYNNSFEKAFEEPSKLNKFIKFLNKKL